MEVSITAVSRNRKFTKAMVRHAAAIAELESAVAIVDTSKLSFDIFQVVFLDRSAEYVKLFGLKEDRLFQVEVATPSEQSLDYNDSSAFKKCLALRLRAAAEASKLPVDTKAQLNEATNSFV